MNFQIYYLEFSFLHLFSLLNFGLIFTLYLTFLILQPPFFRGPPFAPCVPIFLHSKSILHGFSSSLTWYPLFLHIEKFPKAPLLPHLLSRGGIPYHIFVSFPLSHFQAISRHLLKSFSSIKLPALHFSSKHYYSNSISKRGKM